MILVNVVCEIDKCDIGECAIDKMRLMNVILISVTLMRVILINVRYTMGLNSYLPTRCIARVIIYDGVLE